jgi:hypothetical protein
MGNLSEKEKSNEDFSLLSHLKHADGTRDC